MKNNRSKSRNVIAAVLGLAVCGTAYAETDPVAENSGAGSETRDSGSGRQMRSGESYRGRGRYERFEGREPRVQAAEQIRPDSVPPSSTEDNGHRRESADERPLATPVEGRNPESSTAHSESQTEANSVRGRETTAEHAESKQKQPESQEAKSGVVDSNRPAQNPSNGKSQPQVAARNAKKSSKTAGKARKKARTAKTAASKK